MSAVAKEGEGIGAVLLGNHGSLVADLIEMPGGGVWGEIGGWWEGGRERRRSLE